MNEKLRPCPFCGGTKVTLLFDICSHETNGVFCPSCKAVTKWGHLEMGRKETFGEFSARWVEQWNRRANDE